MHWVYASPEKLHASTNPFFRLLESGPSPVYAFVGSERFLFAENGKVHIPKIDCVYGLLVLNLYLRTGEFEVCSKSEWVMDGASDKKGDHSLVRVKYMYNECDNHWVQRLMSWHIGPHMMQ